MKPRHVASPLMRSLHIPLALLTLALVMILASQYAGKAVAQNSERHREIDDAVKRAISGQPFSIYDPGLNIGAILASGGAAYQFGALEIRLALEAMGESRARASFLANQLANPGNYKIVYTGPTNVVFK